MSFCSGQNKVAIYNNKMAVLMVATVDNGKWNNPGQGHQGHHQLKYELIF